MRRMFIVPLLGILLGAEVASAIEWNATQPADSRQHYVAVVVTMPYTWVSGEFDQAKQQTFKTAMAAAATTAVGNVEIIQVTEGSIDPAGMGSSPSTAATIKVVVAIVTNDPQGMDKLVAALGSTASGAKAKINAELTKNGLALASDVTEPNQMSGRPGARPTPALFQPALGAENICTNKADFKGAHIDARSTYSCQWRLDSVLQFSGWEFDGAPCTVAMFADPGVSTDLATLIHEYGPACCKGECSAVRCFDEASTAIGRDKCDHVSTSSPSAASPAPAAASSSPLSHPSTGLALAALSLAVFAVM